MLISCLVSHCACWLVGNDSTIVQWEYVVTHPCSIPELAEMIVNSHARFYVNTVVLISIQAFWNMTTATLICAVACIRLVRLSHKPDPFDASTLTN